MFIRNNKRFNIYASAVIDGVRYANFLNPDVRAQLGITEIPEPDAPVDYSADTYYRTEQDDAPYVVYTKKSPEQLAAQRWETLKQIRDDLTDNGGCFVAGKWFHTDAKSKQQQMALIMLGASLPTGIQWKMMDGSFIELTQQIVADLFAAQIAREQAIFAIAEAKRQDDAPVDAGWPDRYVEPVVEAPVADPVVEPAP